jgi:hypothetical protein
MGSRGSAGMAADEDIGLYLAGRGKKSGQDGFSMP